MLSPSDFNNAVPQFTNGTYASNPINPQYVNEPTSTEYNQGVEPLQTLPAQWWNWFINKFTGRFNKINTYVKNIFNELTELLSLSNITPDGTEETPTTCQLKDMFACCYPDYVKCCTTGTACGCIPVIGSELCCEANHIVVTDASGNLKPTSFTVGTAAGCSASCFMPSGSTITFARELKTCDRVSDTCVLTCNVFMIGDPNKICLSGRYTDCNEDSGICCVCYPIVKVDCSCSSYRSCCAWLANMICACNALCFICKGRSGCYYCFWICANQDIFLYQRPVQCPLGVGGPSTGCGPYFIHAHDYLYWNCTVSTQCKGCWGQIWCTNLGTTSYPGEAAAACCFTSKCGNWQYNADGTGATNRGNWVVIPVNPMLFT